MIPQSIAAIAFLLPSRKVTINPLYEGKTTLQKWMSLDFLGGFLSLAMITSLLLPLQWGGNTREWNDPVVIGLLAAVSTYFGVHISYLSLSVWGSGHYLRIVGMVHGVCSLPRP